jgi:hypothetical protein
MSTDRAHFVSSYTIVKGAMIDETYQALSQWQFTSSKRENLAHIKATNSIRAKTESRLSDVTKILGRRFEPAGRDRALVILAQSGCELEEWKPLLLWHLSRDEFLLKDFLIHWLFPTCYESSATFVKAEDLHLYLLNVAVRSGEVKNKWTPTTLHRVATALLRVAEDFGLLGDGNTRQFAPYRLPERSFIYLLHVLLEKYGSPKKIIHAPEWRMFLVSPSEVERECLRLHKLGTLEFDSSGARLTLPSGSAEEYALTMVALAPGSRCETSFAEGGVEWRDPKNEKVEHAHVFVGALCASQLIFAWASRDQTAPLWVQAHQRMFEAFGGVPEMTVWGWREPAPVQCRRPDLSPEAAIAVHYSTDVVAANPERPAELALVASKGKTLMRAFRLLYRGYSFSSLTEINYALARLVDRMNRKVRSPSKQSAYQQWVRQELRALEPLPGVALEATQWKHLPVHADGTVSLESAYYSVPHQYRGQRVRVRVASGEIAIFVGHDRVAHHVRDSLRHGVRHVAQEHRLDNAVARSEAVPRKLLIDARDITPALHGVVDELFASDTSSNLRRAEGLVGRAYKEIKTYGNPQARKTIDEAIEQMRRVGNFRVRYFEATLRQLRVRPQSPGGAGRVGEAVGR